MTKPDLSPDVDAAALAPGRGDAWMQTSTGRSFFPLDPRPDEVHVVDIAHGLSNICRYAGHTRRFYSVAEHCVIVSLMVPERLARAALLHDGAEAYLGDVPRGIKYHPLMQPFRDAEAKLEAVIEQAFGLVITDEDRAEIKAIDDRIVLDEIHEMMPYPSRYIERRSKRAASTERLNVVIGGWPPGYAKRMFLDRFGDLFPEYRAQRREALGVAL